MKSSPDTENISSDALYFVTKATVSLSQNIFFYDTEQPIFTFLKKLLKEFFVEYLSQEIYRSSGKKSELTYSGLAEIVQTSDSMEFLKGILARNINIF